MRKSKVTIIIPMYNVGKYVSKCLDSILKQTYSNFEVLAVDDGSPDNSKDIVKEYAERDNRIKLIVKPNGGYGSVLQYCIKKIQTKYFLICDPDDWLEKDALKRLVGFAEKNNVDITIGDKYEVFVNSNKKKWVKTFSAKSKILPKKVYSIPNNIQEFISGQVSPHAKLYKTSITKNIEFPFKVNYTDTILYDISLLNAKRVAYYNQALAYYLIDRPGNSTTTALNKKSINDLIIVWLSIFKQTLNNQQGINRIMMYHLYCLFEGILDTLSHHSLKFYKYNFSKKIDVLILNLQKYGDVIAPCINKSNSLKKKLMFRKLMNPNSCKKMIVIYILSKKIK